MTRINEIKERLANATPGPWEYIDGSVLAFIASEGEKCVVADEGMGEWKYDGRFIAHAPTDIAYLLRIAEAAEVMREALEFYKLQGFFNYYDDKHKIHDYGERSIKALAKAKELMGE